MIYEQLLKTPSGRMSKDDLISILGLNGRQLRIQKDIEVNQLHRPIGSSSHFSGYFLLTTDEQYAANIGELQSRIDALESTKRELLEQRLQLKKVSHTEQLILDFGD